jgi:hypothetical protein
MRLVRPSATRRISFWPTDRTVVGWENTITKMARLGAKGSDDDFSDVADYLTANFPPTAVQKDICKYGDR